MSEAELQWLGLRLTGARRHKARRGGLPAPTGHVWHEGGLVLDPDEAVVRAIRVLFERFRVEPSVWSLLRWARATGVEMPTRRSWADGTSEMQYRRGMATRTGTRYPGSYLRKTVRSFIRDVIEQQPSLGGTGTVG